jgi:hypothetical protein
MCSEQLSELSDVSLLFNRSFPLHRYLTVISLR